MEKEGTSSIFSNGRPNWEDQNDPFESALSSMVSSPTASNANGENMVLRELIGRLGSICNSTSNNTSCYSTPLNSPPKLNLDRPLHFLSLPTLAADPAFADRAARFSCFANNNFPPKLDPANIPPPAVQENWESIEKNFMPSRSSTPDNASDSKENSTVSEQIPLPQNAANPRKRKSAPKLKGKEATTPPPNPPKDVSASENSESSAKRSKSEQDKANQKDNSKLPEPPKDYIHVRARRGQATDAHSLAERVRREKISERMKVLQDLVPGCNKVTGKAVMLDEIINYVQSLQRQVEFLSMKLATVNPRMDFNMEALMSKEMFHSRGSLPYSSDGYPFQPQSIPCGNEAPFPPSSANGRNQGVQMPNMENFGDAASQVSSFWEDELHSIVQMGFGQGQMQNFPGIVSTAQMKVEL